MGERGGVLLSLQTLRRDHGKVRKQRGRVIVYSYLCVLLRSEKISTTLYILMCVAYLPSHPILADFEFDLPASILSFSQL